MSDSDIDGDIDSDGEVSSAEDFTDESGDEVGGSLPHTLDTDCECSLGYGNVKVSVIKDELSNQQVDVIVNSTGSKLELSQGVASRALSEKAGASVQQECKSKYPDGITDGQIAATGGGNLQCTHVFHVSLQKWQSANGKRQLKRLVEKCLKNSSEMNQCSISFPALGTGSLGYDKDLVAKTMFHAVEQFESRHSKTTLVDVRFVVYQADMATLQAFTNICQGNTLDTTARALHTDTVGNITVNIVTGKLAEQKCDIIMTTCTQGLDMKRGTLSKCVLDAAGAQLQTQCKAKYPGGIKHGQIAVLDAHNLSCKNVYCGALPRHDKPDKTNPVQLLCQLVTTCLQQASTDGHTSICFPTLGTGYLMYPPGVSANTMVKAIADFSNNNAASTLKTVYIVILNTASNIVKNEKCFVSECKASKSQPVVRPKQKPRTPPKKAPKPAKSSVGIPVPAKKTTVTPVGSTPDLQSPDRHTPAFCMFMYGQTDIYPPLTWTVFTNKKTVKQWKVEKAGKDVYTLVDVDKSTFKAIENLVHRTWEPDKLGQGRDAQGLGDLAHTRLKVTKIQRVENVTLYEKYSRMQQDVFHKAGEESMLKKLSQLKGCKIGQPKTEQYLDANMKDQLFDEINETYLFHGTKSDLVACLLKQGMDPRMAMGQAVFGQGIYMAESSTKADQYTDERKAARKSKNLQMFLVRTCLGNICMMNTVKQLRRPPCTDTSCLSDTCSHDKRYDSVVEEGKYIFREFVVYETSQAYPEYVITYDRV